MENTTKQQLLALGMKEEELGNWCSDLHVLKNDISTDYFINKYEFPENVKTFRSAIDGTRWYDVPFAYSEYHTEREPAKSALVQEPKKRMGMHLRVYRNTRMGDSTNGGVTATADTVLLVGDGVPEVFEDSGHFPVLVLERRTIGSREYISAHPIAKAKGVGWMMGGNFIHTSDSRLSEIGIHYPIPVHDRTESQEQYDMLSR